MNGTWAKVANRITIFSPLGMAAEATEGPLTGSKRFTVYTPRGPRTEAAVYGDMRSSTVPASQLAAAIHAAWEMACHENAAGIRAFAKRAR